MEATVEIKGGIDPAGALERLGAANESASAALASNPRCKNFLIAGVITAEMQSRLEQERLFERYFGLVGLLSDASARAEFFDEVFNHALRLNYAKFVTLPICPYSSRPSVDEPAPATLK